VIDNAPREWGFGIRIGKDAAHITISRITSRKM
jgi:hypothetical protein